ncbi:hypothetical protein [Alkalihalobacillus deserti]|uniref:hypothetical protein n=1 Tax=Alkalihalobacillus deserti TaxID=2879466 RepID=UPI001D15A6C8|nr:hypothetical protein [Alkalihalobacillus deserti]
MKPGQIAQFAHLSPFETVKEFNESMKQARYLHGHHFTKGEHAALFTLAQFSVKHIGVCHARIDKLVQASQTKKQARSTFERMLRKAKKYNILSVHHTIREKGGYSHNVYIFHRFDGAILTDRKKLSTPTPAITPTTNQPSETRSFKSLNSSKTIKDHLIQEIRIESLESLDFTFVPSYVPEPFVTAVKPFLNKAKEICSLWDRARIAHRNNQLKQPIDVQVYTVIQAFKESIYQLKSNQIKTSFTPYFYGTVNKLFYIEKRKENPVIEHWNWLDENHARIKSESFLTWLSGAQTGS